MQRNRRPLATVYFVTAVAGIALMVFFCGPHVFTFLARWQ